MALNTPAQYRPGTVGKPLAENDMKLDADGELLVKGPGVFGGYRNDPRSDLFTPDGYYRTGDYASFDADGYLQLNGRKSELIKTSTGRRISPIGIEQVLESVAYVNRAVVVGSGRKCLAAILFVDPRAHETLAQVGLGGAPRSCAATAQENNRFGEVLEAARAVAGHERPGGYLVSARQLSIEAGELTPNLKLKRGAIEEAYAAELEDLYREIDQAEEGLPLWRVALR
jgi:long-chain acyl-CoA synthetase